jgi:predicted DNA-binding transcriptional regulator YafY
MRADRLVAILLLLQQRGHVTAGEVADELEVSERTARRDLEALGMAGLPVYSMQGRGGGWRLAGDGKTDLSGLSAAEARALFLVAGPASDATPEVRAALRKLVRALPEPMRKGAEAASSAIVVDPRGWNDTSAPQRRPPPTHLDAVQQAVVGGEQVVLGYVSRDGTATTRTVHPLGLAAKGQVWYLVADTDAGQRTFRVDRVRSIEPTGDPVVRPEGFELAEAWQSISDTVEEKRAPFRARATVDAEALTLLRWIFGTRVRIGPSTDDDRVEVELRGHSLPALAGELGGLGARIHVLDPPELRAELGRIGAELAALYR